MKFILALALLIGLAFGQDPPPTKQETEDDYNFRLVYRGTPFYCEDGRRVPCTIKELQKGINKGRGFTCKPTAAEPQCKSGVTLKPYAFGGPCCPVRTLHHGPGCTY